MNDKEIDQLLDEMSNKLSEFINKNHRSDPLIIGIHTGGHWIASKLKQKMDNSLPLGELNIAFYRDDFSKIGMHPRVKPSNLPLKIEDRHIILIDDVLHTGRTIRAAMNELFDYGRPATITLAVLVERSGHELPIKADVVGKTLQLKPSEHVKLLGPEPLALEINQQNDGE
jgi:pyrimidine operon attenuation protein/uracil phosphoribosyltransferase